MPFFGILKAVKITRHLKMEDLLAFHWEVHQDQYALKNKFKYF